jgi:starch synthase (maltosyl-transferring)
MSADVFKEGTEVLAAELRWQRAGAPKWLTVPMQEDLNHRFHAVVEPADVGLYDFVIEAWTDRFATWSRDVRAKHDAGQDIEVELEEGAMMVEAATRHAVPSAARRSKNKRAQQLEAVAAAMRRAGSGLSNRLGPALEEKTAALMKTMAPRDDLTASALMQLSVERRRAKVGAWYELFPRSYGGLQGTIKRLPAVAEMGFDVLYLPPIHPIGRTHRKGANNSVVSSPDDPGSPWGIGASEGGHTAILPELGSFEDLQALLDEAKALGLEVALDYALQCSPDHPWVKEHPEWFHQRPDGSIKYAENPPKKYQDIYPINFWPAAGRQELWDACKQILDFWIDKGIKIFRVDNPHTKPLAFWEWMLKAVRRDHPDVIFLAEAFTYPKMMSKLAEIGFSQSYTYFTWRTTKQELAEYVNELAYGPQSGYFRPNFWPNTPDILSGQLRWGNRAAFKLRLALAATLSPSYGIYSGYELCENEPYSDHDEEYRYSEKYEVKDRDWDSPGSLAPYAGRLNDIRRRHPSLQELSNVTFHYAGNEKVIAYSKTSADLDRLLIIVNLDPGSAQETDLGLDLGRLGLDSGRSFRVTEELTGWSADWWGSNQIVRLDPAVEPAWVLSLSQ